MRGRFLSLKVKVVMMVLGMAVFLTASALIVSYYIYSEVITEHYAKMTANLVKTTAEILDEGDVRELSQEIVDRYRTVCGGEAPPDLDNASGQERETYFAAFAGIEDMAAYRRIYESVRKIREANQVLSLYLAYMDPQTDKCVYLCVDSAEQVICPPGALDQIEMCNRELMARGQYDFPAYITNYSQYGWLCSACAAMRDGTGDVLANVCVDISMEDVMQDRRDFLRRLLCALAGMTLILILIGVHVISKTVVHPINLLAKSTAGFVENRKENGTGTVQDLHIRTNDEIGRLAEAVGKMERDINEYIDNIAKVTAEKERIGAELTVATQIQASMMPSIFPQFANQDAFEIAAFMQPAKEVGGDFYDFFLVDEHHLAIVMADVSGKGVPAALFMVIGKTLIKDHTQPGRDLGAVFHEVNNILCESNSENLFITAFVGVLDLVTGEFPYVNAGHELPFICHEGSFEAQRIAPGFVLAGLENMQYQAGCFTLAQGDKLFQYTDGVTEATNAEDHLYGMQRLSDVLNRNSECSPEEILRAVKGDIDAFVGEAPQFDDITMLCLTFRERREQENRFSFDCERI